MGIVLALYWYSTGMLRWLCTVAFLVLDWHCTRSTMVQSCGPPSERCAPKDPDDDVRWSALRALPVVVRHGSRAAVTAAVRCANDEDEPIRTAARLRPELPVVSTCRHMDDMYV